MDGQKHIDKVVHSDYGYTVDDSVYTRAKKARKVQRKLDALGDKKIIVYGAGIHTQKLYAATDIAEMNVIGFVDKTKDTFQGVAVQRPTYEVLSQADAIVISTFVFLDEIKQYLDSLGLGEKAVSLYDEDDTSDFFLYHPEHWRMTGAVDAEVGIKEEFGGIMQAMDEQCRQLTRNSDYYVMYTMFPKRAEDYMLEYAQVEPYDASHIGIAIHPHYVSDNDFTLESIKLYQKAYPGCKIAITLWPDEYDDPRFDPYKELGIEVLMNPPRPPQIVEPGTQMIHVNHLLLSAHTAIARLRELGVSRVLRIKGDQRMNNLAMLRWFDAMIERCPCGPLQRERLIVQANVIDLLFWAPMHFTYGHIDDMMAFHHYEEPYTGKEHWPGFALNVTEQPDIETVMMERYFTQTLHAECSAQGHHKAMDDYFIQVEERVLDTFWHKVTNMRYEGITPRPPVNCTGYRRMGNFL